MAWVQSLVRELRSCKLHGVAKKVLIITQKALRDLLTLLPLPHHLSPLTSSYSSLSCSVPATQGPTLFLKRVRHSPTSGPLHMLLPVPGKLLPSNSRVARVSSLLGLCSNCFLLKRPSLATLLKCPHLITPSFCSAYFFLEALVTPRPCSTCLFGLLSYHPVVGECPDGGALLLGVRQPLVLCLACIRCSRNPFPFLCKLTHLRLHH